MIGVNHHFLRYFIKSQNSANIEIFDIAGRLVKQLHNDKDPIGEYSHTWDGREISGKLVPPGLYLYRIVAEIQSEQSINSGIVSVVY